MIASDFEEPGDADVIRKVEGDFEIHGKAYTAGLIAQKLEEFEAEAKVAVAAEMD